MTICGNRTKYAPLKPFTDARSKRGDNLRQIMPHVVAIYLLSTFCVKYYFLSVRNSYCFYFARSSHFGTEIAVYMVMNARQTINQKKELKMKITKPITKMSTGHLRGLLNKLYTERGRVEEENAKIRGGCASWPCNGDGTPITPEHPTLPINLIPEIEDELYHRWEG